MIKLVKSYIIAVCVQSNEYSLLYNATQINDLSLVLAYRLNDLYRFHPSILVCMRACVRACVLECVRACVRVCVCVSGTVKTPVILNGAFGLKQLSKLFLPRF